MYSACFCLPQQPAAIRIVIGVPTAGCRWWRQGHGCIHCPAGTIVSSGMRRPDPLSLVIEEVQRYKGSLVHAVCLYSPGSILDPTEVPFNTLLEIVQHISERLGPSRVVVECRPELVLCVELPELVRAASPSVLEIMIPLESVDADHRRAIGKMFSNEEFTEAAERVQRSGAKFSTTVLLKPPGMSERGAIEDACRSIAWARRLQPSRTVLEPMFVHAGSPLQRMYLDGEYIPPWLWSVFAVLRTLPMHDIEVGGEFHYPAPYATPRGCEMCSGDMWRMLRERRFDAAPAIASCGCKCRARWDDEVGGTAIIAAIQQRVCP